MNLEQTELALVFQCNLWVTCDSTYDVKARNKLRTSQYIFLILLWWMWSKSDTKYLTSCFMEDGSLCVSVDDKIKTYSAIVCNCQDKVPGTGVVWLWMNKINSPEAPSLHQGGDKHTLHETNTHLPWHEWGGHGHGHGHGHGQTCTFLGINKTNMHLPWHQQDKHAPSLASTRQTCTFLRFEVVWQWRQSAFYYSTKHTTTGHGGLVLRYSFIRNHKDKLACWDALHKDKRYSTYVFYTMVVITRCCLIATNQKSLFQVQKTHIASSLSISIPSTNTLYT